MVRFVLGVGIIVLAVGLAASPSGVVAQEPTLAAVLQRAAEYVAGYQVKLASVVAEERYRQAVFSGFGGRAASAPLRRELHSDVLLVKPQGDDRWIQFRDVFEVDGRAVRDRDERLAKLFLQPLETARTHAELIQQEGSRYNLGPLMRTVNVPILALIFFDARYQPRLEFRTGKIGDGVGLETMADPQQIWRVEFKEVSSQTLIRAESSRDLPSRGRVWIDSATGRILKTELQVSDIRVRSEIAVTYRLEPELSLLVPEQMRERYLLTRTMMRIDGTATYSKFRAFKVTTTEKTQQ